MKHHPSYFPFFLPLLMSLLAKESNNVEAVTTPKMASHHLRGLITFDTIPQARKGKGGEDNIFDVNPTLPPTPVPWSINGNSTALPTTSPGGFPTPSPTDTPNLAPIESLLGEVTANDATPSPSAISPSPQPAHASCQAAKAGEVYKTPKSETVEIEYELLTLAGSPLSALATIVDGRCQDYLALNLVDCSLAADSDIQGIDTAIQSTFTDFKCQHIEGYNEAENFCFVMKGSLKVYLSLASDLTTEDVQDAVWSTLRIAINGPSSNRGRILQELKSEISDPDLGILDIYFLNDSSRSVSEVNNQAQNGQSQEKGMSGPAAAALMGFTFLVFGTIGLFVFRKRTTRDDNESTLKATVAVTGNNTSEFSGSPGVRHCEGETIHIITPCTPSQLSYPTDGSGSDLIPPASLFEAYEATPAEEGGNNHVTYSCRSKRSSGRSTARNLRIEKIVPPADQVDELLNQPPPFIGKIPRSAMGRPLNGTPKSARSSPRKQRATLPERDGDPADDWELQAFDDTLQPTADFSMTGFLNGHCAAMEEFHGSKQQGYGSHGKPAKQLPKSKISPTSVLEHDLNDLKTTPISRRNLFMSSVNLWTSKCDHSRSDEEENDQDNDKENWSAWNQVNKVFSPYGIDVDPSLDRICGPSRVDSSPERGRSPTPIANATNSRRSRARTPSPSTTSTPSRSRKVPEHRFRIQRYSDPELSSASKIQPEYSSTRRHPSSRRKKKSCSLLIPDTVQL